MGNSSSNHSNLDHTKADYLTRILPLSAGSLIQTTTYNKWIKSQKDIAETGRSVALWDFIMILLLYKSQQTEVVYLLSFISLIFQQRKFWDILRWYECYISPNKKRIFLRPDSFTRVVALPDNYILENVTLHSSVANLKVDVIPPIFRAHVVTFNSLAGDDCIVMASGRDIEIRSVISWTVLRQSQNLDLPSSIQQIKSSPLGDFLAIRCVHPVHCKEYSINLIAIVCFRKLEILLKVDVRGCYWPVSEVINLQVFPHFCPSESSVAIMKNCSYTRKISIYKLPVKRLNLQYLCRRVILHVVSYKELEKLPLPDKII
ncbi:hypothetical protein KUTeg_015014, partial [Tegillarca granosa]